MDTIKKYIITNLEKLVDIPSPSGFTKEVMEFIEEEVKAILAKNPLYAKQSDAEKAAALTA